MQVRATAAALRRDAFGQHLDDRVEVLAIQIAIRIGAADQRVEIVFLPIASGGLGDNLLRQNVERSFRNFQPVQFARTE